MDKIAFNRKVLLHTQLFSMKLQHNMFEGRIISKVIWPPWSLDLTPPDYFLWGAVKGTVYKDSLHTLPELKESITNFSGNISPTDLFFLCLYTQNKTCRCVSTDMWVPHPTFAVT